MKSYFELTNEERNEALASLLEEYNSFVNEGLKLDLSRGKPNSSQLDISEGLLSVDMSSANAFSADGFDCRNYGVLDGLPETKRFFAEVLDVPAEYITVGGNSSLQMMYDTLARAMMYGVYGSSSPWCQQGELKWICVAPGYDRHFRITELMGFKLLCVPMNEDGPDMDAVEELVKDPAVKGIWCVPKYSNPTGNTYTEQTVRRLCSMKCAAPDFRIMWDNAYAVHDFTADGDVLPDVFRIAREYGNEDRIFYYSSTSKVTFPGSGVAIMASNDNNRRQIAPYLGAQTIGYDKINQLRHLKFFGTAENLKKHMLKLGGAIGRKFDVTLEELKSLDGLGIASWTKPRGGYFVSLDVLPGTAKRVYSLMKNAGVTLTSVGATYPYGIDPEDKNLRLAPTYPTDSELELALKVLTVSVKIAALEKLLA